MSRPGFMVYFAEWGALDGLNDAQFRDVFRAAFRYAQTGDEQTIDDPMASLAFQMLRHKLDDDLARYKSKCKKNQDNANKRWHEKDTDACERTKTDANDANINLNSNSNSNSNLSQEREGIPTVGEVEEYAQSAGLDVDVHEFMRIQNENGWMDSQGRPIRNWKFWLKWYAQHFPKKPKDDPPQPIFFY